MSNQRPLASSEGFPDNGQSSTDVMPFIQQMPMEGAFTIPITFIDIPNRSNDENDD